MPSELEPFIQEVMDLLIEQRNMIRKLSTPSFKGGFCESPVKEKKNQIYISSENGYFWYRLDENNQHVPIMGTAIKGIITNVYLREMWPNDTMFKPTLKLRFDMNIGDSTEQFITGYTAVDPRTQEWGQTAFTKTFVRALKGMTPEQRANPIVLEIKEGDKKKKALLPTLYDLSGSFIQMAEQNDAAQDLASISDTIRMEQGLTPFSDCLEEYREESNALIKQIGKEEALSRLKTVYNKERRDFLTPLEYESYVAGLRMVVKKLEYAKNGK